MKRLSNAATSVTSPYVQLFPAGHFYSPLPDIASIQSPEIDSFDKSVSECPGVALRVPRQLHVLDELAAFYDELPFLEAPSPSFRYYFDNPYYAYGDAVVLYGMLRRLRPRRVIEVGSGFSSAVMLDTDERFLDRHTQFVFIEPYPDRLLGLLTEEDQDRATILDRPVQAVDPTVFEALDAGDILFVDSSHVVKAGSDVLHLLTHVLPHLRPGVIIHFHDVLWPFEYPKAWLLEGRAWNEAYFLRAFLQYNDSFEIEYFNDYVATQHPGVLNEKMPMCMLNPGGGLWLVKSQ